MKKKGLAIILCCLIVWAAAFSAVSAETLGFGYVNAKDVAIRRGIGGKTIGRLPRDTCVWIKDAKTDGSGVLWYEVNAGVNQNYTNLDYTGWMKAEFIDAGETLWHDVESVAAAGNSIIVLRKDGTAQSAGGSIISSATGKRVSLRRWADGLHDLHQVGVCDMGLVNYAVGKDGTWHATAAPLENDHKNIRLAGGKYWLFSLTTDNRLLTGNCEYNWVWPQQVSAEQLSHVTAIRNSFCRVLFLTDEGNLLVGCHTHMEDPHGTSEPDWENWTDLISMEAAAANFTEPNAQYYSVYAGIRKDGSVLAAPDELKELIGDWQGMKKIVVAGTWVIGLKQDGTVLAAGNAGLPDVAGWTGITDIDAGNDYCVGLRSDGTLVFAGEHIFMGEGHNRK